MKRPLLKILSLTFILSVTITFTLIALAPPPKTSRPPLSRFGVKGELVYIVTRLDSSLGQSDLQLGDMIRLTSVGGQIRDIAKFQQDVRATAPNTAIEATVARFNPSSGIFEERQSVLKTFPIPKRPALSRLSVVGQTGFIIREIDPALGLSELKVGDIISATSLGGQITNVEKFQKDVRATAQFTAIQATILRFNPGTRSFEERQIVLRTIPYPSVPKKQKSAANPAKFGASALSQEDEGCDVACFWCCERCLGSSPNVEGGLSACETGRTHCEKLNGNCQFWDCV